MVLARRENCSKDPLKFVDVRLDLLAGRKVTRGGNGRDIAGR